MERICGIYKITNKINGHSYIGQSVNIYERWHSHKYADCKSSVIHSAIKKYRVENFNFEILERCPREQLNEREIYWIEYYNTYKDGYNLTIGGSAPMLYDYKEIYDLWISGLSCKEIQNKLKCSDGVITQALRYYDVSEKEVRARIVNNKPIVAIDILTQKPLKVFSSIREANFFFNDNLLQVGGLARNIKKGFRWKGYFWEYLNKNNSPKENLSNEEFLKYQQSPIKTYTQEQKEQFSLLNRKVERPTREELKKKIRILPFTHIGELYGVSDNAVRKWCDYYNLPRRIKDIKQYTDEEWDKL